MNKYLELIKNGTAYAKRMEKLSRRIFGDVVRDTNKTSMRVVDRMSKKPYYEINHIVDYYPRHIEINVLIARLRKYGLFCDEHQDFKDEMKRLRKLRGKGPRMKGEGRQKTRDLVQQNVV